MIRKDFYLTEQQITRLEAVSEKTGIKVSELIRRAIDLFLKSEEKDNGTHNKKRS